jgi:ADP-heptose:LPS heptosyltransferase
VLQLSPVATRCGADDGGEAEVSTRIQQILFAASSRLTDTFPVLGARLLDATVPAVWGNGPVSAFCARRSQGIARRMRAFRRFLIISDIHIGDAVVVQPALAAVRDFFPDATIDYAINRAVAPLIEGSPDATRVLPIFDGGALPCPADVAALRSVVETGRYDLCVSFCAFIAQADIAGPDQPFVNFVAHHGAAILCNEKDASRINHFSFEGYRFVREVLGAVAAPVRDECFPGARTTYSDAAIEGAARFAAAVGLSPSTPVVMYNPDTASRFTLMPFDAQVELLQEIAARAPRATAILLGAGHTAAGIGERLLAALPTGVQGAVRIVPRSMSLDVYAALIDFADVFVSGDTGPLHLAAARRYARSRRHQFRNRTAVLSFFGATPPRMSGYASLRPGYLPANQDAPSFCYQAASPCRNITCLNKLFKTCATPRCFAHVEVDGLAAAAAAHLHSLRFSAPPEVEQREQAGG